MFDAQLHFAMPTEDEERRLSAHPDVMRARLLLEMARAHDIKNRRN